MSLAANTIIFNTYLALSKSTSPLGEKQLSDFIIFGPPSVLHVYNHKKIMNKNYDHSSVANTILKNVSV
jgi:hypothetical protein